MTPWAQSTVALMVMVAQSLESPLLLAGMILGGQAWDRQSLGSNPGSSVADHEVLGRSFNLFVHPYPFHRVSPSFLHTSLGW